MQPINRKLRAKQGEIKNKQSEGTFYPKRTNSLKQAIRDATRERIKQERRREKAFMNCHELKVMPRREELAARHLFSNIPSVLKIVQTQENANAR